VELKGVKVLMAEMWVPVRKLVVDDAYQRSVNEARARRYAIDWNQALAGLVVLSARKDGTFAILDGQHRARGAMIRGFPQVWAEVWFDLTPELEAHIFRERNRKRVATNSIDDFRAAVAEGDSQALRVKNVLASLGLSVGNYGKDPNIYACVAALFTLDTWQVLRETLALSREVWPATVHAKAQPMVMGLGLVLWNYKGQINSERFKEHFETAPLATWLSDAGSLKATLGKRTWEHVARIIVRHYNKRLVNKLDENMKLPPKRTTSTLKDRRNDNG
jgi:hypothetical protein